MDRTRGSARIAKNFAFALFGLVATESDEAFMTM